jgi:hypothetical protein
MYITRRILHSSTTEKEPRERLNHLHWHLALMLLFKSHVILALGFLHLAFTSTLRE